MNRKDKSHRILDLLGRPPKRRDLGMSNLEQMKDQELDALLAQLEEETATMANALRNWLKPDARRRLFGSETQAGPSDDDELPKSLASGQDH